MLGKQIDLKIELIALVGSRQRANGMLPVKAVIASAGFSSLLAVRASCLSRSRSVSMFLRSAELNSPRIARSSAI
jgi:hypothetical protein